MTAPNDVGLARIRRHLTAMGAESLTLFKGNYFDRRLQSRLRVRGVPDSDTYADLLDRDPDERRRLVSALAIGVTGFFRNPTAWGRLGSLLGDSAAPVTFTAWSAGCATGEEAWSLALLLADLEGRGRGPIDWRVEGTDLDDRSLEVARAGVYSPRATADIAAVLGSAPGDVSSDRFTVPAEVRQRVRFRQADLAAAPPLGDLDLILCRNVLIYFTPAAQSRVMDQLLGALRPGGLLMLGKAELAAFDLLPRLEIVDRRERIYRRIA
ncbi:MAG: protein-glutamate O-methyltransferase CheR [Gemmatimonadetes bacterium]|nr:protein-glutamate O-methyltransferase CheR [Gemmatimonadota bacterium]MCC7134298.1 protein-glutamate O-methyltransferase CheR [Gemmatimonadales bacterium]